jgi:hypothetical protein
MQATKKVTKARTTPSQDTEADGQKYQRGAAVHYSELLSCIHSTINCLSKTTGEWFSKDSSTDDAPASRIDCWGAIRRLQACARRYIVRLRLSYLFDVRMETYRQQILLLWQSAHTSLCFRSKFWPLIKETISSVGIAEAELRRLWKELGINSSLYLRKWRRSF